MRDEQLEKRIAEAVDHAAPDVLDRILSSYDEQKGNVITMSEIVNNNTTNTKKHKNRWAPLVAVAAALALCVSVFGYNFWKSGNAVDSVVMLDVNPSISLTINAREEVIRANALNEEAQVVLGDMDLTGTDLNVAVNAIIGSMLQNGYLSDLQNSILVSVENADEQRSAQLQTEISNAISSSFGSSGVSASVLSQTVTETDELTQLAQTYGISVGKAALIQEVVAQDATLTVESLAPLSINEIALISSSRNLTSNTVSQTGSASDKAYIGKDAALSAAAARTLERIVNQLLQRGRGLIEPTLLHPVADLIQQGLLLRNEIRRFIQRFLQLLPESLHALFGGCVTLFHLVGLPAVCRQAHDISAYRQGVGADAEDVPLFLLHGGFRVVALARGSAIDGV